MKKLKFYSDGQHGWLAVKRQFLIDLGIIDKITSYSYQSKTGGTVYLEGDVDVTTLFETYQLKHGRDLKLDFQIDSVYHDRSPIRSYNRFIQGV
jgi:hypothetical protein